LYSRLSNKEGTVDFDKLGGLIPAVVQDDASGDVLMVGFMNRAALEQTVASGYATFYSRTRQRLWTKGETSGNRLRVTQLLVDCDRDTLLVKAVTEGNGRVCHTGERTCFFQPLPVQKVGR
jgi:phosphoribosyl-ATP pyrophosphohydrolase/phosphoribosyl-AMP cyclohydrolase